MKRTLILIVALLIALVMGACRGESEPEPEGPAEPAATAAPATTAPKPTLPPPVIDDAEPDAYPGVEPEAPAGEAPVAEIVDEPWPADAFGYGIQVHGNATVSDPGDTMAAVREQLGLDWVKMQLQWYLVDRPETEQWFFYDAVVEQAHENGLNLMVSLVAAPEYTRASDDHNGPPDDYNELARFLDAMLTRYDGMIDAVEVWNEQNLDREWATANGVSPEDYVAMLQVAYDTIKAHDPEIIVISGALSPTGPGDWVSWADDFEYMDRALAAGMLNYADCVGAHHNGYNIAPDVAFDETSAAPQAAAALFRGPFDNPYHLWSFKTTIDTYAEKVQAIDPEMKLCVTEFGWASSEGYDEIPEGFAFAADNSLEDQANYIVQAYEQMRTSGDVWLAFLFNFDFGNKGNGPTDDPVPYSIIDVNGVPRPAFGAVAGMEKTP